MDQLQVFHKKSAGDSSLKLPNGFWHMATCLRSIIVTEETLRPAELCSHQLMKGEEAYEFLLKIICGLDSPLLGETEVFGQFKSFYKNHRNEFTKNLGDNLERLIRDGKKLRANFLQNLGCTSYGSLLRKEIRGAQENITILGAGSLAQDIFPWFAKVETHLQVLTREPSKYSDLSLPDNCEMLSFNKISQAQKNGVLVIAAPLSSSWVTEQFNLSQYSQIFDLRGESDQDPIVAESVTPLKLLFSNIEQNKRQAEKVKSRALEAIKIKTGNHRMVERPRPFGWEDLWTSS